MEPENTAQIKSQALVNPAAFAAKMESIHVADAVEALNVLDPPTATSVLTVISLPLCISIFDEAGLDHPHKLIAAVSEDRAAAILKGISADRRTDIFRKLAEPERRRYSKLLPVVIQSSLMQLLAYPPLTAGGMMTREFISMPPDWSVDQALRHIKEVGGKKETIYAIYLVDPATQRLVQAISLKDLILADPVARLDSLGQHREPLTAAPSADRSHVAGLISKYDLLAIPVVEKSGQIIGIVTVDDVIDAIVDEATEEVQHFGGMESLDGPYLEISFLAMIKKRAGWLCALFLSEMLTASAMQHFESELEKAVVLTLFIPLIMSSGGNSGSQATSLIIRALALREVRLRDWWRIAARELPAGLVLRTILGVIGFIRIA
jgi:magnesium transporter